MLPNQSQVLKTRIDPAFCRCSSPAACFTFFRTCFFIGTVNSNSGFGGTVSKQFASWLELLLLCRKHMHFNLCCINYALGSFGSCSALSLRRLIWLIQQSFGLCHDHLLLGPGAILNSLCWLRLESAAIWWQFVRKVLLPESGA